MNTASSATPKNRLSNFFITNPRRNSKKRGPIVWPPVGSTMWLELAVGDPGVVSSHAVVDGGADRGQTGLVARNLQRPLDEHHHGRGVHRLVQFCVELGIVRNRTQVGLPAVRVGSCDPKWRTQ